MTEDGCAAAVNGNTGNLLAQRPGSLPDSILLSAHMDRVEQGLGIKPLIEDDIVRTDGSTILAGDDICGLSAILEGIQRALEAGEPMRSIEILFTVCEERGCLGSHHFNSGTLKSNCGFIFDFGGDFGKIVTKAPYKAVVTIEAFGKAAHAAAAPEKGINAVLGMCHMLDGIQDGKLDFESTANLGAISGGGDNIGTVCDYVKVQGEARSHQLEKLNQYLQYVEERCAQRAQEFGITCKVTWEMAYNGYCISQSSPVLSMAKEIMGELDTEPVEAQAMGGTDANNLNNASLECVALGSGYYNAHSVQEYVRISHLEKLAEFVHKAVTR